MQGQKEIKVANGRDRSSDKEKEKEGRTIEKPLDVMGNDNVEEQEE